jgi:ABC-type branched-subunit amino acid transport system substrate-binding protein
MRAALTAYAATVNRAGGIHQRRLELIVASDYREARDRFAKEPVFALLSPVELEGKGELGAFILRAKLPTVGPLGSAPNLISESHGFVFQVLPGLAEEAAVLVDFAARRAGAALRGAIVASGAAADEEAAQAADRRCAHRGCGELVRIGWYATRFDAAAAVKRLKAERREQLFYFGADVEFGELLGELGRASDASWRPVVYAPGALARAALGARERFSGALFLAFPAAPAGRTPQAAQAWDALRQEFKLGTQYGAAQMAALAAASVLVEGLRRAGRQLSRERFVQALESLNNYDPQGYGPTVSFGPDRRAGARGGYVVELEPGRGLVPVSGWIALD